LNDNKSINGNLSATKIEESFHVQRATYEIARKEASTTWRDKQSKYKTEKYHNLPLEKRKVFIINILFLL
jgi:hypothetical protein